MRIAANIILVAAIWALTLGNINAQGRSVGTTWSFSGVGVAYEHINRNDVLVHVGAQLEAAESFLGRGGLPGASFSITWSNIFARTESVNGNEVLFYAGTGVMTGYCKDMSYINEPDPYGIVFGLQGRLGTTIIYDRKINISICIAPVIGMHLTHTDDTMNMMYYKYGLIRTIMPEIGLQYRF